MVTRKRLGCVMIVVLAAVATSAAEPAAPKARLTAAGHPAEGKIDAFLGEPKLDFVQVFPDERFPNVVVATDGTILATWGATSLRVRRSEDGGATWGDTIAIGPGIQAGGATVDETTGDVLVFVEERHPPAPLTVYRSRDHGKTWKAQETTIRPDANGNVPSMCMNEHGITLRHGKHAGRLVRPARHYGVSNDRQYWPTHYTTAIYSDDDGATWDTSKPFAETATGEACVVELSDGRLYYNSRSHWNEHKPPKRRRHAWSDDGGETWRDWQVVEILPDGPQNTTYGCMGGMTRLPIEGRDIVLFGNCDSPGGRHHGTVWVSFDGGKTWPLKRLVFEGPFAYSSLFAGRPGTKSEGQAYLFFEGGPKGGATMARFNLSWLLAGKKTGDGTLPEWLESPKKGTGSVDDPQK